jgi:hypothetical protein
MIYFVIYAIATGDVLSSLALRGDAPTTTIMRHCQEEAARRTMMHFVTSRNLGFRCEMRGPSIETSRSSSVQN